MKPLFFFNETLAAHNQLASKHKTQVLQSIKALHQVYTPLHVPTVDIFHSKPVLKEDAMDIYDVTVVPYIHRFGRGGGGG